MADLGEDIGVTPSTDPLGDFEAFLREHGLEPRGPIRADGRIQRCVTVTKLRDKNGAYMLDMSGPVAWGWCQDWQVDDKAAYWFGDSVQPGEHVGLVEAGRLAYEAERQAMQDECARNAAKRWDNAAAIWQRGAETYLDRKGIQYNGARLQGDSTILVPMYDGDTGELVNIQSITPDGEKRFMKGGKVAGCNYVVGAPYELPVDTIFVAEGFATAASLYEATGRPCVVAFSAANLAATYKWLKQRTADSTRVTVACDNDERGRKALDAIVGDGPISFAYPETGKDFNDMAAAVGLEAVQEHLFPAESDDWEIKAPEPVKSAFIIDDDGPIEQGSYIIKKQGLLPSRGTGLMGGQSGAGKTFMGVHLAVSVASGARFFELPIHRRCGVAYVAAEGGAGFKKRLRAAKEFRCLDGRRLPIGHLPGSMGDLMKDANVLALMAELKKLNLEFIREFEMPLGIVIIDTVATAFIMEDESNADASKVCAQLKKMSDATRTFVMGVHHYGKNAELGFRGGSSFRANIDIALAVLCDRDGDLEPKNRRLAIEKNREGLEGKLGGFHLHEWCLGLDYENESIDTCAVVEDDWPRARPKQSAEPKPAKVTQTDLALDALHSAIGAHGVIPHGLTHTSATREQWQEGFYALLVDAEDGAKRQAFSKHSRALVASGNVGNAGAWYWVVPYNEIQS
jgi:AAA domain/Toprim domain